MSSRSQLLPHFTWALVALIAFAVGYSFSEPPHPAVIPVEGAGAGEIRKEAVPAGSVAANAGEGSHANPMVELRTPEQFRARTFELLAEPNRFKRMRQLCDLLEAVTPENWREVREAFIRQTATEGRTHDQEWHLMHERLGEVAGAAAAQSLVNPNSANLSWDSRNLLTGWAQASPDAAVAWLQEQSAQTQQSAVGTILSGVAGSDPRQALDLALSQSPQVAEAVIPGIIDATIQRGGFREAEELFESVRSRDDIPEQVRTRMLSQLAWKQVNMNRLRGEPLASLSWLERHLEQPISVEPRGTQMIIASVADRDVAAALGWLEQRPDRLNQAQAEAAYTTVAQQWHRKSPEQLSAWLNAHPDHPRRDAMIRAITPRQDSSQ